MKKILTIILIVFGLLAVGGYLLYQWGLSYASNQVVDRVATNYVSEESIELWMENPTVQSVVGTIDREELEAKREELPFQTREEGIEVVLDRFSIGELTDIATTARGGLTEEEQTALLHAYGDRLSQEEYQALLLVLLSE